MDSLGMSLWAKKEDQERHKTILLDSQGIGEAIMKGVIKFKWSDEEYTEEDIMELIKENRLTMQRSNINYEPKGAFKKIHNRLCPNSYANHSKALCQ